MLGDMRNRLQVWGVGGGGGRWVGRLGSDGILIYRVRFCSEVKRRTETGRPAAAGLVVFIVLVILAFIVHISLPLLSLKGRHFLCTHTTNQSEEAGSILTN